MFSNSPVCSKSGNALELLKVTIICHRGFANKRASVISKTALNMKILRYVPTLAYAKFISSLLFTFCFSYSALLLVRSIHIREIKGDYLIAH